MGRTPQQIKLYSARSTPRFIALGNVPLIAQEANGWRFSLTTTPNLLISRDVLSVEVSGPSRLLEDNNDNDDVLFECFDATYP